MGSHMMNMGPLLRLDLKEEVRMIGIWGPSGIGKTTIARFLFNRHSKDFELRVFMEDVKRVSLPNYFDDYGVKLNLQEKLMSKITNHEGFKIPHLGVVKDMLKDKNIIVVLDDVDQLVQLDAMAKETSWFGPGSRIIITTQDENLLKNIRYIYRVDFPSSNKAFKIFCMYAFGRESPKDGFMELAWKVTRLAGELPLGLRVMGSHFRGKSKQEWTNALPRLMMTQFNGEIESKLKFSYDALCDEDKKLFLHISCFFNYEKVDVVEGCLASSFTEVTRGLQVLAEKSLISMPWGIEMHNLLVQLGKEVVRKQSVDKPWEHQFLCDPKDIGEVLSAADKADSSNVLGIDLTFSSDDKEDIICTSKRAFAKLSNLQFLRINNDTGTNLRNLNFVPKKIRFLSWNKFPLSRFPCGFHPTFLVKLKMRYSKLEKLWEGTQPLSNLKWMDLSWSTCLKVLPDLSSATNLCELDLAHCSSLVELPSSIGNAINLREVRLNYCSSLVALPSSMRNLRRMWKLELEKCSRLEVFLTNINLERLVIFDISGCSSLRTNPEASTTVEENLELLGIVTKEVYSRMIRPFQEHVSVIMYREMRELGPWMGRISCLIELDISGMQNLVSLPQLPYSITDLNANDCKSLERIDYSFRNPHIGLNFANCVKLNQEARDLILYTSTTRESVLPGEEVPACFTYRTSGRFLTLELSQNALHTKKRFRACVILSDKNENDSRIGKQGSVQYTIMTTKYQTITSGMVLVPYFRENMYTFEVNEVEVTSTKLLFYFKLDYWAHKTWEINECGIAELYESLGDGETNTETQVRQRSMKRKTVQGDGKE